MPLPGTVIAIAGQHLVAVFELFEYILLRVPFEDILRSQRVSRQFPSVIDGSSELQRAVFFSPEPPRTYGRGRNLRCHPVMFTADCLTRAPSRFMLGRKVMHLKALKPSVLAQWRKDYHNGCGNVQLHFLLPED